jgi:putative nucleotidyltransferase with HDIG domain
MSAPLVAKWQGLLAQGRFLDVVEELEKTRIRLTISGNGFRVDGPTALLSPELSQLLDQYASELAVVLRLSTLGTDSLGLTRLHHAVLTDDTAEVRRHLTNGARPNQENRFGQTPFHAAVSRGQQHVVEALALAGADFSKPDVDGRTPLHLAVESRQSDVVAFLLVNGAPVNQGDFFGLTPLARAVATEQAEIAQLLVEYGGALEDPQLPPTEREFLQLVLRMINGYSEELYAHSLRVADVARCLARDLELAPDEVKTVRLGGLLHDLGKVSLPDDIFDQADADLSDEEVELLMSHPEDGAEALPASAVPARWPVRTVVLHHHEKWDGSGFPAGLSGTDIPLAAQLVGLADYYDHLVTHRSYDPAMPQKQALEHLNSLAGQHFGEEVLDSLFRVSDLLPYYTPKKGA